MGANSVDLLRMLEPAVRPVGPGAAAPRVRTPLEERSFDELLAEERGRAGEGPAEAGSGEAGGAAKVDPLSALASLDGIENASLRGLIGGRGGGTAAA